MVAHTCNLSMQRTKQEKQEFTIHLHSKFKDHMGYMRPDLNTKTKQSSLFQFSVVRERTGEIQSRQGKQRPRTKKERTRGGPGDSMVKQQGCCIHSQSLRDANIQKVKSLVVSN